MVGVETCTWGDVKATLWVANSTVAHDASSTWPKPATAGTSIYGATMESGYPSRSGNVLQFRAVFSTGVANWAWDNWWLHTATASGAGIPMNHASTQALGTKTSAQSWQITSCVTVTT